MSTTPTIISVNPGLGCHDLPNFGMGVVVSGSWGVHEILYPIMYIAQEYEMIKLSKLVTFQK